MKVIKIVEMGTHLDKLEKYHVPKIKKNGFK
jgi:hypothetical protein